MKCNRCGKIMVSSVPGMINAGSSPSRWMWCICGNEQLEMFVEPYKPPEDKETRWKKANDETQN